MSPISLKIEAEGQREKQAAFRPAHPSCLCLSCSTAMLRAMFAVIRDGTFLHLARSSLLHLFFFVFRQNFPQAQTFQEAIPESTRAARRWSAPTSGNDAACAVLF